MSEKFDTILTNAGLAAVANATITQKQVNFAKLGVGDSNGAYYTPTQEATALRNQKWIGNASSVTTDLDNPNWIVVKAVIPGTVGGFEIRELGIFDENNVLLAIGKLPQTYKPTFSEGSIKELTVKTVFEVTNTSAVTLKIDPSVIYASEKYVDDKVATVVSGLENVQQQLNQQTAAIDTKLDTHIKDDSGHVRFIGNASGGDGMACRTDLAPVDLVNGKLVPKRGYAFRFFKVDGPNTGPATLAIVSDTLPGHPSSATYQILNSKGQPLKGGELVKDGIYTLAFNGTAFILQGEGGEIPTGTNGYRVFAQGTHTFVIPEGVTRLTALMWGGGGGGGGARTKSEYGGGGGGAGNFKRVVINVKPNSTIGIVVGGGGYGGTAYTGDASYGADGGYAGGSTYFNSGVDGNIIAYGGGPGEGGQVSRGGYAGSGGTNDYPGSMSAITHVSNRVNGTVYNFTQANIPKVQASTIGASGAPSNSYLGGGGGGGSSDLVGGLAGGNVDGSGPHHAGIGAAIYSYYQGTNGGAGNASDITNGYNGGIGAGGAGGNAFNRPNGGSGGPGRMVLIW